MSKKKELKELRERVAQLEAEVAVLRAQRNITWTAPLSPGLERQWWQSPWVCTDPGAATRGYRPVVRSGGSISDSGTTYTWN